MPVVTIEIRGQMCWYCLAPATESINGVAFCNEPHHAELAVAAAFGPVNAGRDKARKTK